MKKAGISKRLSEILEHLSLSITEVAEKTGMSYKTVYNYLRGDREPNAEAMVKFNRHLGISINWLLTGDGHMFVNQEPDDSSPKPQDEPYVSSMARKTAEMMSGWSEEEQKEFLKSAEEKLEQIEARKRQAEEMEEIRAQMAELEKLLHKSA
ncbi:helix-turn-helix domain-containing protein [Shewanella algae]|uniref:helix-turn-helix domain-containing protein n=1 Tax=Shewanella algae TaxID=38313 RepID=UPI001AADFE53|nr:helix-turn-helix domain-containing protein [Shewanella algae]MBO2656196.1 helix-turn-helix domain-containing protein [Shewanella algae]